jgi:glutathione peroxidase
VVFGFPYNQFGRQEPGSNEEIKQFCSSKYNVTFPLFDKIEGSGDKRHPL